MFKINVNKRIVGSEAQAILNVDQLDIWRMLIILVGKGSFRKVPYRYVTRILYTGTKARRI